MLIGYQEQWDQFIGNSNAIDPAFQFYPMNLEPSPPGGDGQQQQQQEQNDPSNPFGGPFMGANTPGR